MQENLRKLQEKVLAEILPKTWELWTSGRHPDSPRNWFSIRHIHSGRIVSINSDSTVPASSMEQTRGLALKLAASGVVN